MKKQVFWFLFPVIAVVLGAFIYSCTEEEEDLKGAIYGTVTDLQTNEPIGGVNVKLRPSGEATLTGSDGSFEFKDLDAGKYSLSFSKSEYADLEDDFIIELEAGKKVKRDVQMRKKIASLQVTDMAGNPLDTLDFGTEESVTVKTFNLFNDGTESLVCTANYECAWITNVSGLENPIQPGQTAPVTMRIDRVALDDGVNVTFLYITSGNGSNEIVVKATFQGSVVMTTTNASSVGATSATVGGNITDDGGRPVLARGICYGTSQSPDINGEHTQDGSGTGAFSHNITGLSSATTYYARAYATNRNGTYYASNIVSFTTTDGLPTVTTTNITDITATTAKSGGNVTNNGGYNVTARGVCWNTLGSPDLNDPHTTNGSGNGTFTSNMTGLTAGTTYYVRAYATNSQGTSYGEEQQFTALDGAVSMVLSDAENITATTATCNVEITDDGGSSVTERGVCWGSSQYPTTNDYHVAVGNGTGSFTVSMSGLFPSITYYVRAYAVNEAGTSYSNQISFTTASGLATVSTGVASNITATSATYSGSITNNGGYNVTSRGFCWNTTGNPDISDQHTTNGSGNGTFTGNLTGLTPGTTYHVRAYATNSTGTSYGNETTFITSSGTVTMTLSAATNITASSASCSVTISDDGGATITERGICWSTAQYPSTASSSVAMGSGTGTFNASMSGLSPSTTYYVRAYAINSTGTNYSNQINLTTADGMPTVTTGSVNNITATTATCSGNVTNDGGFTVTAKGLCWSTSQYPTIEGSHSNDGGGTGSFNGSMNDLQIGTTYYVRAYATNSTGTSYGSQVSFTTGSGLPTVTTTTPTLNDTTVVTGGNVTSDGGFAVTARGICYGPLPNPDLTSTYSHTTNGSGTGYYSSTFPLPNGSGTYYIRAYATNANGTSYGEQVTVIQPYDELPSFQYGGHTYKVAPISNNYLEWSDANTYCNNLTLYGYTDWRLPTKDELLQMYNDRSSIGGFSVFAYYWSSTSCGSSGEMHFEVDFNTGSPNCNYDNVDSPVRPIRMDN